MPDSKKKNIRPVYHDRMQNEFVERIEFKHKNKKILNNVETGTKRYSLTPIQLTKRIGEKKEGSCCGTLILHCDSNIWKDKTKMFSD